MAQDFTKKIVLVLNRELDGWQLTNTVGHLSAYLGSKIGGNLTSRTTFETNDEMKLPANSQYPVITMAAKAGQMYNFLLAVEAAGLDYLAYTQEMIDFNDDEELAADFKTKDRGELNYLGIGIFGDNEVVKGLTKKFSLWR